MSTNFPSSIDSFPAPGPTLASNPHSSLHQNADDAITAIETKVGADNSAVTTSIDYKLKSTSSLDPGHKHTPSISLAATGTPSATTALFGDNTWKAAQFKFGGTGSDGALGISTGTTTINLGAARYVERNYTSVSITGTAQLAFSNPHANGTIFVMKCQGAVTLTSAASPGIDLSGMGSAAGAGRSDGVNTPSAGTAAYMSNPFHSIPTNSGATPGTKPTLADPITLFKSGLILAPGAGAGGGGDYGGGSNGRGGPGGASLINDGGAPGAGGGNTGNGTAGAGGRGGGAFYMECAGAYTNTSFTISCAGIAGTNSTVGDGAGGGGSGGTLIVLYNSLASDTGTYSIAGGAAGTGANAAQNGGTGAAGYSFIGLNTNFS